MAAIPDVTTVLLDLDETICEHPRSTADRLEDAFEASSVDPFFDVADFRRWLPKVVAKSELELREKCFAGIADDYDCDPADALAVARAYADPDPAAVEFLPGAEAALDALCEDHVLALVTNGGRETQREKLAALGIADRFETATYTEPGGPVKPDPEPFERTLAALDADPAEAVHVGNSLRADVAGAHAAGVTSVWLEQPTASVDVTPHHTIASMRDLRARDALPWSA